MKKSKTEINWPVETKEGLIFNNSFFFEDFLWAFDTFGINDAFIFWASCHTQLTQLAVVALDAIFVDNYCYAKNLRHWFVPSRNNDCQTVLQSDWARMYYSHQFKILLNKLRKKHFYVLRILSIFHFKLLLVWPNHP